MTRRWKRLSNRLTGGGGEQAAHAQLGPVGSADKAAAKVVAAAAVGGEGDAEAQRMEQTQRANLLILRPAGRLAGWLT